MSCQPSSFFDIELSHFQCVGLLHCAISFLCKHHLFHTCLYNADSTEEQYEQLHLVFSQTLVGRLLNDFEIQNKVQNEGTAEDQNKIWNEGTADNLVQQYVGDLLCMVYTCVHICPDDKRIECNVSFDYIA